MSYRGGGLPYGGRAPVSYDDVDSSRDSRPAPPGDRNGYGGGGRGGYDRDYRGGGRGYDSEYERDRGAGEIAEAIGPALLLRHAQDVATPAHPPVLPLDDDATRALLP
ncbi:hypothetical protein Rt10032_c04g1991 [Rhodotorula toruloides]|uniref:Uncharacterized protein n=1 Tax=Rhodotorula toruloides TaxID=5286 RepID=A0A511KEY3_RHOTO|nr:hypothetical protein Rt10032_c04g1991 [Rhodotorula toruloides]